MRYWVVDSETTGVGSNDRACEVAGFLFEDDRFIRYHHSLVNPGIPIPPEASAIHHIRDRDVANAPGIDEAMMPFFDDEFEFVVAHQASFDKRMMDFGQCPWVCTLKLARAVYPDAPNHKNQFLRYWLDLPDLIHAIQAEAAPHRALYDSEVTTYLFQHLLTKATSDEPVERMIHISNNPRMLKVCKLKKHEGKLWSEVPRDYLNWIVNPRQPHPQPFDEDIVFTAKHYLGV